jgi:hypothetical protein
MYGKWQRRIRRSATGSRVLPWLGAPSAIGAWVDADDLDAAAAQLHGLRFVDEEPRRLELREACAPRKRVAAVLDVVVAQNRVDDNFAALKQILEVGHR